MFSLFHHNFIVGVGDFSNLDRWMLYMESITRDIVLPGSLHLDLLTYAPFTRSGGLSFPLPVGKNSLFIQVASCRRESEKARSYTKLSEVG